MNKSDNRIIQILIRLYFAIGTLIFFLILPISFSIFHILNYFHLINSIYYHGDMFSFFYYCLFYYFSYVILDNITSLLFSKKSKPTITFIIPYIKFISYPQDYNWWKELIKPKPSPFVETITNDIYKTWNGEALLGIRMENIIMQ